MYYHFQKRQSKGHEAFIKYLCFSVWCLPLSFSSACLLIFCVPGVFFYLSSAVNPIIYNLLSHRFQAAFRTVIPPSCQQQHSHNHSLGPSMQRNIFLTECHLVELTEDVAPQFPRQLSVLSSQLPAALCTGQAPRKELAKSWHPCGSVLWKGGGMSHNLRLLIWYEGGKMTLGTYISNSSFFPNKCENCYLNLDLKPRTSWFLVSFPLS